MSIHLTIGAETIGALDIVRVSSSRVLHDEASLSSAEFVLLIDAADVPLALVRAASVASFENDAAWDSLLVEPAPVIVVDADVPTEDAVSVLGPELTAAGDLPGIVVVQDQRPVGVVPRERVENIALTLSLLVERGGDFGLPGRVMVPTAYFKCSHGDYRRLVSRYDPAQPPTCPRHGTPLVRGN